jgi:O-antigen/teichoic acid export membrane protein
LDKIKKQTLYSTIFSYLGVGMGFVTQFFLMTKYLEAEQVGLLALLLSFTYTISQVSNLGFNSAGGKYFPYFYDPKTGHRGYLFTGVLISLIGFFLVTIILFIGKSYFVGSQTDKTGLFEKYYFLIIPLGFSNLFFNIFDNYARVLQNTVYGTFLSQFLIRFFQFVSVLTLAFAVFQFPQFIYVWVVALSLPTVFMLYKCTQLEGFSFRQDFSIFTPQFKKDFINFSYLSLLTGFSSMIIMYIDKYMVYKYLNLREAGIYAIAFFFVSFIGMPLVALNKAASPVIANAMKNEDLATVQNIYTKSCITSLIMGCWVVMGIIVGYDSLHALIPKVYAEGKWVVFILAISKLTDMATGLNGLILQYSKYFKYDTYSMYSLIVVIIVLNLIFIPLFGLIGVAIASAISVVYYNTFRTIIVWRKLGLQPFSWLNLKILLIAFLIITPIYFIPSFGETPVLLILDIILRSGLVTFFFIGAMYKMKASAEFNGLIDKGLRMLGVNT